MTVLAILAFLVSLIFFALGWVALRKRRLFGSAMSTLSAVVLLLLAGLFILIGVSTRGYQALTREDLALTLHTRPTGLGTFEARAVWPDGREETYQLTGDEVYVDAHILKWKPLANLLGLHTAYELDRIAGRHIDIDDERTMDRTIYGLGKEKPVDMFDLRRRYAIFTPLLDAEYGSASFVSVRRPVTLEVRVSTTGLLIRTVR